MDKTFAAIEKLKEVELELHRLKNALEMMNRAYESKKEWQGLTDEEIDWLWGLAFKANLQNIPRHFARMVEEKLKEKNHAI